MRKIITSAAGEVKLGDKLLPGVYQQMDVDGELRIDEKDVPGSSGSRKQPIGFEDAVVTLTLRLLTDEQSDCYEKVAELVRIFKAVDGTAKPFTYRIVNRLLDAWGIKEVHFKALRTPDKNKSDSIRAELVFVEYRPALVSAEAKAATPPLKSRVVLPPSQGLGDLRAQESGNTSTMVSMADFKVAEASTNDYSDGGARVAKTVPTPAVDDDPVILV